MKLLITPIIVVLTTMLMLPSCMTASSKRNLVSSKREQSPLISASIKGEAETVRVLLSGGADVNAKNDSGGTALMLASYTGEAETVRALLSGGADVNARDDDGVTALKLAKLKNHNEIVQILKQAGARTNHSATESPLFFHRT
jgi:ankyrin repeat protein